MTGRSAAFEFNFDSMRALVLRDRSNANPWQELVIGVPDQDREQALGEAGFEAPQAVLDTNIVLIEHDGGLVLVDTGWGPGERLLELLSSGGVNPEAVNVLILTHSDGDHTGGLMTASGLALPQAELVMHADAWDWWTSQAYLDLVGPELAGAAVRAQSALKPRLKLVMDEAEIAPGVIVRELPGHRAGHMGLLFQGTGDAILHCADGVLHPIFFQRPDWQSGIDSNPELAAATRRELFASAAESGTWLATSHLPFPGLGMVQSSRTGWRWRTARGNGPTHT